MKKNLSMWITVVALLASAIFASQSIAAEFHVANVVEFQDALNTAANNGEDDVIYLAAGTYEGSFGYSPLATEHKALTIRGEPGTTARDIILDGRNSDGVLSLYDDHSAGPLVDIIIDGITMQNGLGHGGASGLQTRFLGEATNVSISNCIIKNNSGPGYGAGIVIEGFPGGNVTLENNLILNNIVTEYYGEYSNGGGAGILYHGSGQVTIRNNIIANNGAAGTAAPHGGGLWIQAWNGSVHLVGNTVYNNEAGKGGGVYFSGADAVNVYNNIIYGNTGAEGGDVYFEYETTANGYNNDYSALHGSWTDFGSNLDIDPLFVDPQNNDFYLQPTSPMIDAGTAEVPDPPGLPAADFNGNPRFFGPAPDIGACETSPVYPRAGTVGTEIILMGSGFGVAKGKVLLGSIGLTILKWKDTWIRGRLTKPFSPGTYDITVQPKGTLPIPLENGFTVKALEIDSLDPSSGSAADQITLNGFFFGSKKGKITLGGKNCKVLRWTMVPTTGESLIRFVVPKGLSSGSQELEVKNGVGPVITNFSVE